MTDQVTPPIGLRQRKKQRTRDALTRAALELFVEQGYEDTTVDEIAEAVDVSQRTFFRYFANKEEVAFSVQELAEAYFYAAVLDRPAHEAPLVALRRSVSAAWESIDEAIREVVPLELHMRAYRMIESTPALLAVHLRRNAELEARFAQEIARREGVDLEADPRPRVLVAAFGGVMRVAAKVWSEGDDCTVAAIRDLTESYLDQLSPALAEDWHRPRPARPSSPNTPNPNPNGHGRGHTVTVAGADGVCRA
ncbi:TetR family transcriptional regulator [Streptomyces buecherae]|uniref:TetR family transcriptional regulator n=1 Tax=Streptomyces buecherae TaxID=2763006 RepID=UPI001C26DEA3|nr:TetR family transcriptional regulator [Streptomyces buecherae]